MCASIDVCAFLYICIFANICIYVSVYMYICKSPPPPGSARMGPREDVHVLAQKSFLVAPNNDKTQQYEIQEELAPL